MERTHAFILILTEKRRHSLISNFSVQLQPSLQVGPHIIYLGFVNPEIACTEISLFSTPSFRHRLQHYVTRKKYNLANIAPYYYGTLAKKLKTFQIAKSKGMQCKTPFRLPYRKSSFSLNLSQALHSLQAGILHGSEHRKLPL